MKLNGDQKVSSICVTEAQEDEEDEKINEIRICSGEKFEQKNNLFFW